MIKSKKIYYENMLFGFVIFDGEMWLAKCAFYLCHNPMKYKTINEATKWIRRQYNSRNERCLYFYKKDSELLAKEFEEDCTHIEKLLLSETPT